MASIFSHECTYILQKRPNKSRRVPVRYDLRVTSRCRFPSGVFSLRLQPVATVIYLVPPERGRDDGLGGVVTLEWISAGRWQVTLSADAWIDAIQNDRRLTPLATTSRPDCPGIRQSVQFELASVERGKEFKLPQKVIDGHQETLEAGAASARKILKAGGRLGMGGDYGFAWNPHGDYAKELTFFVKYVGFTPLQTIMCATKSGAEIIGRGDEFGTLEAGKLADVLVVDGDVVADISVLEDRSKFIAVMQGGIVKAGRLRAER